MTARRTQAQRFSLLLVLAALFGPGRSESHAQYYDEERPYRPLEARYIYAGAMARDFAPRSSNNAPDSATIRYTELMPMIGFHQGVVDVFFGYTRFDQHGKSNATIFFGTLVSTDVHLSGGKSSTLLLPLLFAADYTKAESGGPERDNFNIASVGLGAGLKYRLSTEGFEFSVHAEELAQYSIEGLSTGSGFSAATLADASLIVRDIVLDGLVLGYRFRYQTWSMSDERFDYRAVSHGPYLGVLF
jgi:hypothetical protein